MSIMQAVLLFDSRMPTWPEISRRIEAIGHEVTFHEVGDLRSAEGLVSATFDGHPTALAYEYSDSSEYDWLPGDLVGFGDKLLVLPAIRGELRDLLFAIRFQRAICELSDGAWWAVDFDDECAAPSEALERLDEEAAPIEQRLAQTE